MKSKIFKISLYIIPIVFLFIGCVDSLTSTDKLPPYVAVSSPKTNDTISYGKVKISYTAYDDQEVRSLELYINGTLSNHFELKSGILPELYLENDSSFINTTISYYVKAYDISNNVSTSNVMSGIFVSENRNPPERPYNLIATVLSPTSVRLSWIDSSDNESGFVIMRKESGSTYLQLATVGNNITYFDDFGLDNNKIYFYSVYATNKYGNSEYSNEVNSRGTGPLNAPTNLQGTPLNMNQIKLSWKDNSTEEQKFIIQRKGIADYYFSEVGSVDANTTEYTDKGLWGGTSYNYRVAAQKDTTKSWSEIITVSTYNENIYAPSNLTAVYDSTMHIVKLTWTNNTPSAIFTRIERKEVLPGSVFLQIDSVATGITTYTDENLLMGNTYQYRVRVLTSGGNVSDYSGAINISVPVYPPFAPTDLVLNPFTATFYNLSWKDNSDDEDGFEIWRRDGYLGQFILLKEVDANVHSENDQVTSGSTIYFYKVCSYRIYNDSRVRSAFSNMSNSLGGTSEYPNPTNLKDTALCSSKIKLSWKDNSSDELGFRIERKTEWGVYSLLILLPPNTETFIDDKGINAGTKYFYRIQSFNGSLSSDWIEFPGVTTPLTGICP
jgi:hypothetical protein